MLTLEEIQRKYPAFRGLPEKEIGKILASYLKLHSENSNKEFLEDLKGIMAIEPFKEEVKPITIPVIIRGRGRPRKVWS